MSQHSLWRSKTKTLRWTNAFCFVFSKHTFPHLLFWEQRVPGHLSESLSFCLSVGQWHSLTWHLEGIQRERDKLALTHSKTKRAGRYLSLTLVLYLQNKPVSWSRKGKGEAEQRVKLSPRQHWDTPSEGWLREEAEPSWECREQSTKTKEALCVSSVKVDSESGLCLWLTQCLKQYLFFSSFTDK